VRRGTAARTGRLSGSRVSGRLLGPRGLPLLRPVMRVALASQRRVERGGPYADPWTFIVAKYGPEILAIGDETSWQ
jgi:hypothetical protein